MAEESNVADGAERVLRFWFGGPIESAEALRAQSALWFGPEDQDSQVGAVDQQIAREFRIDMERAATGQLADWAATARGRLALILLLDQFPRNVFRGTARAFTNDSMALQLALEGMQLGADTMLQPLERLFFYLPLEHAEDIGCQELVVARVRALAQQAPDFARTYLDDCAGYAEEHRDIVRRFGRFPHRNAILGRQSTAEESAYLAYVARDFGQKV
jgi:uncharacterized protein (DUF924 family)